MKTFVAICVLSLLVLPTVFSQESDPSTASLTSPVTLNTSENTANAGSLATLNTSNEDLPSDPKITPEDDGLFCQVNIRCKTDLECEVACGRACGPLYVGSCIPLGTTVLDTGCECGLATIE